MVAEAISPEKRLEILYDHYKESFAHIRTYAKQRDRLTLYLFIVAVLMGVHTGSSQEMVGAVQQALEKGSGAFFRLSQQGLGLVLNLAMMALALRYFQLCVTIDRQYRSLQAIERSVEDLIRDPGFGREGRGYLDNYPVFSKWADGLYRWLFPGIIVLVVAVSAAANVPPLASAWNPAGILGASAGVVTVVSTALFLWTVRHEGDNRASKAGLPSEPVEEQDNA
jgi:hypothetical protein